MNKRSIQLALVVLSLVLVAIPVYASPLGLDFVPTGSGARALAMGGAFTAIADDATAAWWNPAGLTQLERPELSLAIQYRKFQGEEITGSPAVDMSGTKTTTSVNFGSFVYPLGGKSDGARKSVSLSYGDIVDFNSSVSDSSGHYGKLEGGINNLTLAFATELTPKLSIGVGLIRYMGSLKDSELVPSSIYDANVDISGSGASIGLLWKDKLFNVGLLYRSSWRMKWDDQSGLLPDIEIRFPKSWAVGVAYKPTENLTAALDLQYLDMSSFSLDPQEQYQDVYQPRVGLEYLIITKAQNVIPLRVGWFSNPQPDYTSTGGTTDGMGYSLGSGIVFKDFQVDLAYVHSERDKHETANRTHVKQDLDRFLISAIYRF